VDNREKEAIKLIETANKKIKGSFFGNIFNSQSNRFEEGLDLFEKAGNMLKLAKNWDKAAECFQKCGELEEKLDVDSASHYLEASHCYSFVDQRKSTDILNKVLAIYEKNGRFQMAGKIQKQMAEKCENELQYELATTYYKKAADYFSMENTNSRSFEQQCLLKAADLMCINDFPNAYLESVKIYEKVGLQYLNVALLKPGAKDLFFKCVCLHIAYGDEFAAQQSLNKFISEDPTFNETREQEFLSEAIEAVKHRKEEELQVAITKLHKYSNMDKWRINVFTKMKNKCSVMQNNGELDYT